MYKLISCQHIPPCGRIKWGWNKECSQNWHTTPQSWAVSLNCRYKNSSCTTAQSPPPGASAGRINLLRQRGEKKKKRKEDKTRVSKCRWVKQQGLCSFAARDKGMHHHQSCTTQTSCLEVHFFSHLFQWKKKLVQLWQWPRALGTEKFLTTYKNNPSCFQDFNGTTVWFYRWIWSANPHHSQLAWMQTKFPSLLCDTVVTSPVQSAVSHTAAPSPLCLLLTWTSNQPYLSLSYPPLSTILLSFLQLSHLPLFSFHSSDFILTTVHSVFLISPLLQDFSRSI